MSNNMPETITKQQKYHEKNPEKSAKKRLNSVMK